MKGLVFLCNTGEEKRLREKISQMRNAQRLAMTAGAIADIATFNPEVIALVNAHPDAFEVVLRPFAHDVALLRTPHGFTENFRLGRRVNEREFINVVP